MRSGRAVPLSRGWPKKRHGDGLLPIAHEWVLLLDADEVLPAELAKNSICDSDPAIDGYSVLLQTCFWAALYATEMSACGNGIVPPGQGALRMPLEGSGRSMADMEVMNMSW